MNTTIDTPIYQLRQGTAPLLISIPHLGAHIPDELAASYTPDALQRVDTDWHLDRLYAMADDLGASVLQAKFSRYVIDLNRPSTGESLYPGQTTTGLCPTTTFTGQAIYREGHEPDGDQMAARVRTYWQPYHDALRSELDRLRAFNAQVLIWEAHSIASVLPRLFEGKLPDLCFGTNDGASCSSELLEAAMAPVHSQDRFSHVVNGRFKGGFNTRHYGVPRDGIHAIQLEMCQSLYMNEAAPFEYRQHLAAQVQPLLKQSLSAALAKLAS